MQSFKAYEAIHDIEGLADIEAALSTIYRRTNQFDSMMIYQQRAYSKYESLGILDSNGRFMMQMGANYTAMGNYPLALSLLQKGVVVNRKMKIDFNVVNCLRDIAFVHEKMNRLDSTIYYEERSIEVAARNGFKQQLIATYKHLTDLYETKDKDIAHQYLKKAWAVNDSVNGPQKIIALETTISEEQERESRAEAENIAAQNRIKQYLFLGGLGVLLLIAFLLYTNNRQKQKANQVLENTLTALKSTQAQLIQSEKLASLGELTAGIAHEIQNPLNFVNNFSDLNRELITEMKEEIEKGNFGEVKTIAEDLETNEERINHHGQRASSIVKGMLEHSQASTGVKEPTDLNALADEFLRLAYHGLRAKDNNFNAMLETHFDPELPLVSVIPQDIGRVLLNLINNAFYAVHQRDVETLHATSLQHPAYQPTVTISTQKIANQILIKVKDNGNGIPESIRDKIFQPFFTTKPTGQGTGLGLSLAYDIVVKGHGGTLEVESTVDAGNPDGIGKGEGTEFIIQLPVVKNIGR